MPSPTAPGMEKFVEDYLETVADDAGTAFAMLTPGFQRQSGGLQGYTEFWSTVEEADLQSFSADVEALTVQYTVEYERVGGGGFTDRVGLQLVYDAGKYLIAGEG